MKQATLATAIVFGLLSSLATGSFAAPGPGWREWDAGLKAAKSSGKPVIVDVYTDWCGWCKRMDRDVYSRSDVREYLDRHFVPIRLNAEGAAAESWKGARYTSRSLAAQFRVTGYPTTIFLTSDGEHLANVPGYLPPERFLLLLRYVGDGHVFKGTSFDDFVKRSGASAR